MKLDNLRPSSNVEDRRDWSELGFDRSGNAYSQDSAGNTFRQDYQPVGSDNAWGGSQSVDGHPELIDHEPFGADTETGKPIYMDEENFGKCNTCKPTKKKRGWLW